MTQRRDRARRGGWDLPIPMIVFVVAPLLAIVTLAGTLVLGYLGALVAVDVYNSLLY